MSLADKKNDVFTKISSYTSFAQQGKLARKGKMFPSINNKKDVIPYLLDVLKTVAGSEALKQLMGGMVTELVDISETQVKNTLKQQFTQNNSDDDIPSTIKNDGIDIPVKNIDLKQKLKIDPNSDSGSLIYNETKTNFDSVSYSAINNPGSSKTFNGLVIKYDDNSDSFNLKVDSDVSISKFFTDYIDNAEIINKNELVTNIMDGIYGTFSNKNNRTPQQILEDLKVQKLLEQAANDNSSFIIPVKDLNDLEEKSKLMSEGIGYYDMGCGYMGVSLSFNSLNNLVSTISGSTDPFVVSNAIENTINESTSGSTASQNITAENNETIKDGFFQKIINIFVTQISQISTQSPQIRALLSIFSFIQGGNNEISTPLQDMKKFKIFIMCLVKKIIATISEFIYNLAIGYLISLLTPIIKKVTEEKINQFIKLIRSLTSSKIIKTINTT
jgi:hypothetical protein